MELEVIHISAETDVLRFALSAFLRGLTLNFSRMLGDFIAGSRREMNHSEMFKIAFKKLPCCE